MLVVALGLAVTVGRPQPARAVTGDNLVLVWDDQTLESIRWNLFAQWVSRRDHHGLDDDAKLFGSDTFGMSVTIPAGSSPVEPATVPAAQVTLSWKSFTAAADQAGSSREYGGIHVTDGDFEARQTGEDVGLQAWAKAKTYFNGKAVPKT